MIETTINDAQTMRDEAVVHARLRPGDEILGRYVVESELGQGGMGVVYKCLDKVGGVEVAVKGLPPEVSHNVDEMEEVRDNYRLVQGLRHPNICAIKTLEKDERGDYYLVMDLARGVNLNRWLRQHPDATDTEKLSILRQIAAALDYAHVRKIIHRDVKPENVMVADDGTAQVLDFGLAAQVRSSLSRTSQAVTSKSGTPGYKAPEQWLGRPQGPASDQYALGVIAYKMFAGFLPFDGDDLTVLGQAVLNAPVPKITVAAADVNVALAKALAKKPEERFSSCTAFVDALERRTLVVLKRPLGKFIKLAAVLVLMVCGGLLYRHQVGVKGSVCQQESVPVSKVDAEAKRPAEENSTNVIAGKTEPTDVSSAKALQLKLALDEGHAALDAEQWEEALAAANRALEWDEASEDAVKLKSDAEAHLVSSLKLEVWVEGREVEGAWVVVDGTDYTSPVELQKLEKGSRIATLAASYEVDGTRYQKTFAAIDIDWTGPKTLMLTLPEVRQRQAGEVKEFDLPGGVKMKFVWCPPGAFTMGSPMDEQGRGDDETPHRVMLTKGFWLGQYEVTQAQWKCVMGDNPSNFKHDDKPVEKVSWEDCQRFIAKCNKHVKGVTFALPTEAQWEYACRAGSTAPYSGAGGLDAMGWYSGNSGEETHPVGKKQPNAWKLYDMHGNVWEWCVDWRDSYGGDCKDPTGPASGEDRVLRGGCWFNLARNCRSAVRSGRWPGSRDFDIGFRLLRSTGPHE